MRNIQHLPVRTHLWTSATTLTDIGIANLYLVLDEIFGILPKDKRQPHDGPFPQTIGDLSTITGIQIGKLIARLGWLSQWSRVLTRPVPTNGEIIVISDNKDLSTPGYFWQTHQLQDILAKVSQLSAEVSIGVDLSAKDEAFSLVMGLRDQGWRHAHIVAKLIGAGAVPQENLQP